MKYRTSGFGTIGILVIIAVIGLVGLAGVYVATRQDDTPASSNQPTTEEQPDTSRADIAAATAEKIKFSALPEDIQAAIEAETAKKAPACLEGDQLVDFNGWPVDPDVAYAPIGSAIVTIGCDGGSAALFAKDKQGQWSFIAATQDLFTCDAIFDNPVPKQLLELSGAQAECQDTASNKVTSYDDALNARFY